MLAEMLVNHYSITCVVHLKGWKGLCVKMNEKRAFKTYSSMCYMISDNSTEIPFQGRKNCSGSQFQKVGGHNDTHTIFTLLLYQID